MRPNLSNILGRKLGPANRPSLGNDALLTAAGGPLDQGPAFREIAALYADGRFLVASAKINDASVVTLQALAMRRGFVIREPQPVTIEDIARCYQQDRERLAEHGLAMPPERDPEMRRRVVEFLAAMAKENVSDVHLKIDDVKTTIRIRRDGLMRDFAEWPAQEGHQFCRTAYTMSDAADATYRPYESQGGRITRAKVEAFPEGLQSVRLQLNALNLDGRDMTMRLHRADREAQHDIRDLGYTPDQQRDIELMSTVSSGAVLVSGPTGSGKSTTLKFIICSLLARQRYERSARSIEDPIELVMPGVNQQTVSNASSSQEREEAFRKAIVAALRSDPDILMIGEIRDFESGMLALTAALSGHQVFTTIHTVTAIGILDRLRALGLPEYLINDPTYITGLISQRLLPCLCQHRCQPIHPDLVDRNLWHRLNTVVPNTRPLRVRNASGCSQCDRGYSDRTVVAETLVPDTEFMDLFWSGKKSEAIAYWKQELGGKTMLETGIARLAEGIFDPADVELAFGPLDRSTKRRNLRPAHEAA